MGLGDHYTTCFYFKINIGYILRTRGLEGYKCTVVIQMKPSILKLSIYDRE